MSTITKQSKIVWISDHTNAVAGFRRMQEEERKTEAGLNRIAAASGRAQKAASVTAARMANLQAQERAALQRTQVTRRTIAQVQDRTRGVGNGGLDITATGRAAARFGTGESGQVARGLVAQRKVRADELRLMRSENVKLRSQVAAKTMAEAQRQTALKDWAKFHMPKEIAEFNRRQALRGDRETRYLAAARAAGLDVNDEGQVVGARMQRAGMLRQTRATQRASVASSAAFDGLIADHSMITSLGRARSQFSPELNAWAADELRKKEDAREQARRKTIDRKDHDAEIDRDKFGNRLAKEKQAREKFRARRESTAQGALAVGAAVTGLAMAADQQLTEYADKIVNVEDTLAGMYGVGTNPEKRTELRRSAIATSIGSGMSLGDIADLRGRMESAFDEATIPMDAKREAESAAIKYRKLGVKDASSTALGLGALYTTYKDDLGGGAGAMRLLANRLQHSQDVGAFDPDQVTPYLAMVGQSFKGAGYKDTDMFASLALASKTGMRAEAFATGSRNLSLLMMEGEKKGLKRTGDFATDVGQLTKLESPELLDIFGRDTFVIAKMFADNTALLKTYLGQQEAITSKMDTLGSKIATMMTDPAFVSAETIKSARQLQENAAVINSQDPALAGAVEDWELRKAGAEREIHPALSWFKKPAVWMETMGSSMYNATDGYLGWEGNSLRDTAARDMINAKRESGEHTLADYYDLKYNPFGTQTFTNADGKVVRTGEAEGKQFMDLRNAGHDDLTASEFTQYLTMKNSGNRGAEAFLADKGFADPQKRYDGVLQGMGQAQARAMADGTVTTDETTEIASMAKMLAEAAKDLKVAAQNFNGEQRGADANNTKGQAVHGKPTGR